MMKIFRILCWGVGFGLALNLSAQVMMETDQLKDHLLVVYNQNDPDSEKLARYYAEKRSILPEHLLGLRCSTEEEISREAYNREIREPIERYLTEQGWLTREATTMTYEGKSIPVQRASQNQIWAIVLLRGMPLKIAPETVAPNTTPPPPEQNPAYSRNEAAVDSELATLPIRDYPLGGPQPNPYAASPTTRSFDALDAKNMILVTRLDAPTTADVIRMIDDTLYAEKNRLAGRVYLDARGLHDPKSGYTMGDEWLRHAFVLLRRDGWNSEIDENPAVYPDNRPWSSVAIYAGWYEWNAQGPFMRRTTCFERGAIAYHIHSFSAATIHSTTANWVGPLLSRGAAATMGSVYEPYLDLTPHLDVFFERLVQGYSFAEAAYASQKVLSWMITVVGDPLYRPFRRSISEVLAENPDVFHRDWLKLQHVQSRQTAAEIQPLRERAQELVLIPDATAVAWEGYADLLRLPEVGAGSAQIPLAYQRAQLLSVTPLDQIRIGLKLATYQASVSQWLNAYNTLDKLAQRFPQDAVTYGLPQTVQMLKAQPNSPPLPPRLQVFAAPSPEPSTPVKK